MKPYTILLLVNIATIVITFLLVMNLPGGDYGMLPLVILPYAGMISLFLFVIVTFIFWKIIKADWRNLIIAVAVLLINVFEASIMGWN